MIHGFFKDIEALVTLLVKDSERKLISINHLIRRQKVDHDTLKLSEPVFVDSVAPDVLILNDVNMVFFSIYVDKTFTLDLVVELPLFLLGINVKLLPQKGNFLGLLGYKN